MSVRGLLRGAAGAMLALALAAGSAAPAAADPVEGIGRVARVAPEEGRVWLRSGRELVASASTQVVDREGAPSTLAKLAAPDGSRGQVAYFGRLSGDVVELERLVLGVAPPR